VGGAAVKRVLVTGAGGSPATNFVRSLRAAPEPVHLAGTDADPYCLLRAETDSRHLVPVAGDPDYLDILNALIEREGVGLVHAQNDAEVAFLSEHRDRVAARLFLPAAETVRACQDKFRSFEVWRAAGLTVPETVLLRSTDDLQAAFERFGGGLWLRATSGAGGKGALPTHDYETARSWLEFHKGWGSFTAAELLEPDSITWMSVWHDGRLVVAQGRRRLYWELSRISPSGVTGVTGAGVTVADPALDEIALAAVLAVDPHPNGLFGVDLTYDRDGVPNPTEINVGRFFTTHQFFTALGVNLPWVYLKLAYGEAPPPFRRPLNPAPEGMVWVRGVDFEPVLATTAEVDGHVAALEELRRTLQG
jgi:glutathione synthase/RimK-type ligase-like ATP-grasp enzyme